MAKSKDVMVGIDMGGTSLRALVVNEENRILAVEKTPTNPALKPERHIMDLAALVEDVVHAARLKRSVLRAVSIGCPGAVDPEEGLIYHAPNLGWDKVALGPKLEKLLHVPVLVENDVNAGVAGEHALGAGQGAQELVGIFVGTGIGGGIVSGGQLYGERLGVAFSGQPEQAHCRRAGLARRANPLVEEAAPRCSRQRGLVPPGRLGAARRHHRGWVRAPQPRGRRRDHNLQD
jgi:predicted NBD/HSP70 family sugar kinase